LKKKIETRVNRRLNLELGCETKTGIGNFEKIKTNWKKN
jgi:hypothetical protein